MPFVRALVILILTAVLPCAAQSLVAVGQDTLTLPSDVDGAPDFNPPFDQFQAVNYYAYVYPYTMRTNFTNATRNQSWRSLYLENEYLRCTILPDLGGHVYNCFDKVAKRDIFYANTAIKKGWVGLRGAWAAFGLELNFPNAHSWVSISPVDFAFKQNPDGSGSVWVGNVDRVTGMQWRSEFVLRPGVAALEQRVTLENRSNFRRRYYWWANAAVRLGERDRFVVPANITSGHGTGVLDSWPVNTSGRDLSSVAAYTGGEGYFAVGSNEEFLGVYQAATRTGLAHVADAKDVPGKKTWTWGTDSWPRQNLSIDNSSYTEIQAGTTPSQEVYEFLEPQQIKSFTEYWLPLRNMGGVTKVSRNGALYLTRTGENVAAEFMAAGVWSGALMQLTDGSSSLAEKRMDIAPDTTPQIASTSPASKPVTFRVLDNAGAILFEHTEGAMDARGTKEVTLGKQPSPPWMTKQSSEPDFLAMADYNERNANYDAALLNYEKGRVAFAASQALAAAQARLLAGLENPAAVKGVGDDVESGYYRAIAASDAKALEALQSDSNYGVAASIRLAELQAASGDTAAIEVLRRAAGAKNVRAGAMEVTLLRAAGNWEEAASRAAHWTALDPTDLVLRYELFRLGTDDPSYWRHMGADIERVLFVAGHFIRLGQFADALQVLEWDYAAVNEIEREPGIPAPARHAMLWYYRAYCKQKLGESGAEELRNAAAQDVRYVFPNGSLAAEVLQAAVKTNAADANAQWLLGCVYFSSRRTDEAITAWERARTLKPQIPSLHRTLGRAYLEVKSDKTKALTVLQEGLKYEAGNADLQQALARAQR
ncbi:MAG: DUF5107 domain-containing protein [Candidatus Solibacter usitatus]|nr:DUF5107 domain-containing protein [Candidatus Solibacter usitatus]